MFLADSILDISASIYQRSLVNESGMVRSKMRTNNKSENGRRAWDALYDTTP
jgi:hypothetical protein